MAALGSHPASGIWGPRPGMGKSLQRLFDLWLSLTLQESPELPRERGTSEG